MADDNIWKKLGWASTIGTTLVAATFIGLAIGLYLDKKLGTAPYLMLVFLLLGIVAGFLNMFKGVTKQK